MLFRPIFMALLLAGAADASDPVPAIPPSCNLTAAAAWASAGEGYRAQAMTEGEACDDASLSLALVSPNGRALWERGVGGASAVRRFYGVPGPAEMQRELEAWIAPAEGKPAVSTELPEWPEDASAPAGFEPAEGVTQLSWTVLRDAALPLFCFDDAPGFQTCVAMSQDETVSEIGRRATR